MWPYSLQLLHRAEPFPELGGVGLTFTLAAAVAAVLVSASAGVVVVEWRMGVAVCGVREMLPVGAAGRSGVLGAVLGAVGVLLKLCASAAIDRLEPVVGGARWTAAGGADADMDMDVELVLPAAVVASGVAGLRRLRPPLLSSLASARVIIAFRSRSMARRDVGSERS